MSGEGSGFESVGHSNASIIVFIDNSIRLLRDVKVIENPADIEDHLGKIIYSHEFIFSEGSHNGELKLGFVANGTNPKTHTYNSEGILWKQACDPVGV